MSAGDLRHGRILKGIGGFYYVYAGNGVLYECRAKGLFRNQNIKPLVGDLVTIEVISEEPPVGNLIDIEARTTELIRPAVSNVDQAVVVFACKDPDPNWNLLDRFLVMMEFQDVPVSICFNKADLIPEERRRMYRRRYESCGYRVLFTSTVAHDGIDSLEAILDGHITVFAGPSGVGKSSLLNEVYGDHLMETGGISEKIRRGKHTTRHSEFFRISDNTYLLDTPGFSSIWLPEIDELQLQQYFPEIAGKAGDCRFQGCVHIGEPDCAVKAAVGKTISRARYENYILLYRELKANRKY